MLNELDYLYSKIPDYKITPTLSIKHPTYTEIAEFGEESYIAKLYNLCSTPDDFKSELFDAGFYWNEIDDITWFNTVFIQQYNEVLSMIFSTDIRNYKLYENKETRETVLYNDSTDDFINRNEVLLIKEHLNSMIGYLYKPHKEIPANKTIQRLLIEEDQFQKEWNKRHSDYNPATIKEVILNVLVNDYYEDRDGVIKKEIKVDFREKSLSMIGISSFRLGEFSVLKKIADEKYEELKEGATTCQ